MISLSSVSCIKIHVWVIPYTIYLYYLLLNIWVGFKFILWTKGCSKCWIWSYGYTVFEHFWKQILFCCFNMFEVQINLTPRLALLGCDNGLSTDLFCPLFHQLLSSAGVVIALEWKSSNSISVGKDLCNIHADILLHLKRIFLLFILTHVR